MHDKMSVDSMETLTVAYHQYETLLYIILVMVSIKTH